MAITQHEIKIRRDGQDAVPAQPIPILFVGDTVKYSSDDGMVHIKFPGKSPFQEQEVDSGTVVTVRNIGTFRCQCFIELNNHAGLVGWRSDPSLSGADHEVPR